MQRQLIASGVLLGVLMAASCTSSASSQKNTANDTSVPVPSSSGNGLAAGTAGTADPSDASDDNAGSWREITIPAGTTLALALDTAVASDTSRMEEPVRAHVTRPVSIDGVTVVPEASAVTGVVTSATRAGKVQGRAHLAIRFDTIVLGGQSDEYRLQTNTVGRTAPSEKKKDAAKIGVPAAGGAVIGGIVGGKKGAVLGGAVGGGAGTAVVLSDRGQEVHLAKGAAISLTLTEPLTVRVRS